MINPTEVAEKVVAEEALKAAVIEAGIAEVIKVEVTSIQIGGGMRAPKQVVMRKIRELRLRQSSRRIRQCSLKKTKLNS